jgi:3',5'-cyclic AMP phosphodiesterase CpdA
MRLAHVSDVHVLESGGRYGLDVRFLSLGRRLDAEGRLRKLSRAFSAAARNAAHHVVVSGDLTESGTPGQFEALAEALHSAPFPPERITLVPGNHDAYGPPAGGFGAAWGAALAGPLRPFARTSSAEPGKVVELDGLNLLPVDVSVAQPVTRSSGELTSDAARALERRLQDTALGKAPAVLVQHHPPFFQGNSAWHWIDGLRGVEMASAMLSRHRHAFVLHGHLHHVSHRALPGETVPRVFGAPAVVDDPDDKSRVRLYEVSHGTFVSAGLADP